MYTQYLQNLLQQNKIYYKTQPQFLEQLHKTQNEHKSQKNKSPPIPNSMKQPLTSKIVQRYSRQMLLKQISYEGQLRLMNAKIAVIGAGGVGCPLALYLAAAGVGTLGIFDSDFVQITNLHRQIGHRTDRIGMQKTQSLKQTIENINPHIKINKHPFIKLQTLQALDNYDFVIDGSDNPGCRYMVNDYCMKTGKKLLSGACIGWQAQITTFGGDSLCYRCLWGNDQLSAGGCSTLGVVGMVPGLVGVLLGIEAIKLIINGSTSLQGKLLTFDGRKCEFKKISLRKKLPACLACGQNKLNMQTYDYSKYNQCAKPNFPEVKEITWQGFVNQRPKELILDVRPSNVYNIVHLQNAINIPNEILANMTKQSVLEKLGKEYENRQIAVSCVRGFTSKLAVKYLQSIGIKACSIKGGILGYRKQFDSNIPEL